MSQLTDSLDEAYRKWSSSAAAVLAKSRRVEVDELPGDAESLLATTMADGLTIRPLYTRKDETAEPGLPGEYPFVRGADPHRDVNVGWRVTERFGDGETRSAAEVNEAILDAFVNGASGLWLAVGDGVSAGDLAEVFTGVYLDLIPVTLDAGTDAVAASRAYLELRRTAQEAPVAARPTAATTGSLGLSPLTAAFSGRPTITDAEATGLAGELVDSGQAVRAFRVDGADFATAGADDSLQLALTVAAAVAHLRDLTSAGISASKALTQLTFAVSADDNQFATIAKFRALRKIWARVADVVGKREAGAAITHGVTDLSMLTQRDPWVNMLRTTIAAFGAGVGGADQVTVLGFDAAIPADLRTSGAQFSRRIARNTQLLLLEESNIGRVIDPAGGSWFVESLTDDLAASAWNIFTEIEGLGGYRTALDSGWITDKVGAALTARDDSVAHRKTSVTGVNEFPNLGEKPIERALADDSAVATGTPKLARVGRAFEGLRDRSDARQEATGARPQVLMIPLGSVAEHNGRTTFVANLLASGGIDAVNPGPVTAEEVAGHVASTPTSVAVLCGTKKRYAEDGPAVLAAARAAGLSTVLLAGPASEWPDPENAPDGALKVGIDAIATLTGLVDQLEAASGSTVGDQS
jgi:methylmalonyl-CoA mutase